MFVLAVAGFIGHSALAQSQQVSISKLKSDFVLRSGGKSLKVPISSTQESTLTKSPTRVEPMVFRKNANYAVWDARGLTVRKGNRSFTSQLTELSVSPKLFEVEEILTTKAFMTLLKRSPFPSSLSGAKRIGSDAYFLVRWDDAFKSPWLEALVKVNLDDEAVRPALIGRFQGYSLATGSERLKVIFDRLAAITQKEDGTWGRATFDPSEKAFSFVPLGENLAKYIPLAAGGCSLEKTPYGSTILSRINIREPSKQQLMESRDSVRLLDGNNPWLAIAHEEKGLWLHNLESGAKLRIPDDGALKRTGMGLMVWTPIAKPAKVLLFELSRFDLIGQWTPELQKQREAADRRSTKKSKNKRKRTRHRR